MPEEVEDVGKIQGHGKGVVKGSKKEFGRMGDWIRKKNKAF